MPRDPICGMEVDPATQWTAQRGGETFYFCCAHCRETFLAGGTRDKKETATPRSGGPDDVYTCPMHPRGGPVRPRGLPEMRHAPWKRNLP